jgi:hypothetical protein
MAALAPMHNASVTIMVNEIAGRFSNWRQALRTLLNMGMRLKLHVAGHQTAMQNSAEGRPT